MKKMLRISTAVLMFLLVVSIKVVAQEVINREDITITSMPFNSDEDDFAAQYVHRGKAIFFTSTRDYPDQGDGHQRIWMVPRQGANDWGEPMDLGEAVSYAKEIGAATLTPDGNLMIFAAFKLETESQTLKGEGRTDLYSAEWRNGQWTNVQNLGAVINSPYWDSQPALSPDGTMLYFSSDRPGGTGEDGTTDIYFARKSPTGWTAPQNIGAPVNSPENEMSPRISPDGTRLFFSSNGHGGVGGYDLFTVRTGDRRSGTAWQNLENLGTPINSEADEHFFESTPNSDNGFFSSNRDGDFDIYLAYPNPYPPSAQVVVTGKVLDERTRQPLEADVTITDLSNGEVVATFRSDDKTGEYLVLLNKGKRYAVTAEAPGYVFFSDEYPVPDDLENGVEINRDILLRQGSTRLLIYFDYDKADLKKESFPDLNRALEFLKDNPSVNVVIAGHTDSVGSDSYNQGLSQRRAESARKYLVDKGIPARRLDAIGVGEAEPVADNGTEEGRALNRRVEMRIRED